MTNEKIVSVDSTRFKLDSDDASKFKLIGFHCPDCSIYIFGPATNCQQCASSVVEPTEFSGNGILYSYTLITVPPSGWPGESPYILVEGELKEGPHVLAEMLEVEVTELYINMPIEITYNIDESQKTATAVYKWKPVIQP